MKYKIFSAPLLALVVILTQTAAAPALEPGKNFYYVDPALIPPTLIAPPPAEHSEMWKKEADDIVALQKSIPAADLAAAISEKKVTIDIMHIDKDLSKSPNTQKLLQNVGADCRTVVENAKAYWHYPRPYNSDERIKPIANDTPGNASYPSGHTTCSAVWAEVLSQLNPAGQDFYRQRAAEIAHHRIQIGVHWFHDIKGGEQLSLIFFGALQTSATYRSDLLPAQKEWQQR